MCRHARDTQSHTTMAVGLAQTGLMFSLCLAFGKVITGRELRTRSTKSIPTHFPWYVSHQRHFRTRIGGIQKLLRREQRSAQVTKAARWPSDSGFTPDNPDENIDGFTWDDVPQEGMPDLNAFNTVKPGFDFDEEFGENSPGNSYQYTNTLISSVPLGPQEQHAFQIDRWKEFDYENHDFNQACSEDEFWFIAEGEAKVFTDKQDGFLVREADLIEIPAGTLMGIDIRRRPLRILRSVGDTL